MIITIDLTSLADNFSGIERYALNISKNMIEQDKMNHYILIFKNFVHSEFKKIISYKNVSYKILKGKNKLFFNQIILPFKLYKIKSDKYVFLAFPSPILFRKKGIINTIHDLTCWDFPQTMNFKSKWYFRISIKNAIKISEFLVTVSNFSKNRIKEKFVLKKNLYVIYNGVSDVFRNFKFNKETNNYVKYKFKLPEKYILCLSTLEPRKNLKLLIKAFTELKKENKLKEKLVLVGRKGWKTDNLLNTLDEKVKQDIIITGYVEDEYLPYVYSNSELFVFPSLYEGFGIPLIEAMYLGINVLFSDIESSKEVVGNNGISFKSNDFKSLVYTLAKHIQVNNNLKNVQKLRLQANNFQWGEQAWYLVKILQ